MIGPTKALTRAGLLLLLAFGVALGGLIGGPALAAEGAIDYVHESEADFAKQLAAKEVKAVTINKRLRTMRVTLADGRHVLATYPKKQEPQTAARLKARGALVAATAAVEDQHGRCDRDHEDHRATDEVADFVVRLLRPCFLLGFLRGQHGHRHTPRPQA